MKDLLTKNIGDEAQLAMSLNSDGDLVLSVVVKSDDVLNALAKKIPGGVDDLLFAAIKAQLKRMGSSGQ